jgi:hypothetical protein
MEKRNSSRKKTQRFSMKFNFIETLSRLNFILFSDILDFFNFMGSGEQIWVFRVGR